MADHPVQIAVAQGRKARKDGKKAEDNPYEVMRLRKAWERGFEGWEEPVEPQKKVYAQRHRPR